MSRNMDWTLYVSSVSFGLVALFILAISLYHTTPFAPQGAKEPRQRCLRDPACRVTFSALGSEQGQPGVGCCGEGAGHRRHRYFGQARGAKTPPVRTSRPDPQSQTAR